MHSQSSFIRMTAQPRDFASATRAAEKGAEWKGTPGDRRRIRGPRRRGGRASSAEVPGGLGPFEHLLVAGRIAEGGAGGVGR